MKLWSHWPVAVLLHSQALLHGACTKEMPPYGQLMVSVETDAPLPDYVDGIRLQIFQERPGKDPKLVFDRQPEALVGPGQLLIPATVAVVASERPDDLVRVRLLARKYGNPRILREAVTQVPRDRIAVLHIVIEWLCDGSAVQGDPLFCSNSAFTCSGGRCVPKWIDPSSLPSYTPQTVNPGAQAPRPCFDVPLCFSAATPAAVDQSTCSINRPEGDLTSTNLALVVAVGTGGECLPAGSCLVSLTRGPLGWSESPDGTALLLPTSVCSTSSKRIKGVVVSRSCKTKAVGVPLCGAWAPSQPSVGDAGSATADAAPAPLACAASTQCPSGLCVDGFCCNEPCDRACTTCAAPGKEGLCTQASAGDRDPHALCVASDPSTCGYNGNCNAQSGCAFWPDGMLCEPFSVANMTLAATCSGAGLCLLPNGRTCTSAPQCRGGFCADKVCCDRSCSGRCETCNLASALGQCVGVPFGSNPAGECDAGNICAAPNFCLATTGPVAKLTFDNDPLPDVVDSISGAKSVPNVRRPQVRTPGVVGRALSLDGSQFVGFDTFLLKSGMPAAFTIAAWIRIQSYDPKAALIAGFRDFNDHPFQYSLTIVDGRPIYGAEAALSAPRIPLNRWTHIAVSSDGGIAFVSVDGSFYGGFVPPKSMTRVGPFTIGALPQATPFDDLDYFFSGEVDELYLFDRNLSPEEMLYLMQSR